MKTIGFIDYYLDEWHANNYPDFIKSCAGDRYTVGCAYGKIDSPIGGMTNREWICPEDSVSPWRKKSRRNRS